MEKTVLALSRTLARDKMAVTPKKTTAISTRETVFDTTSTYPGPQRSDAQEVIDVVKFKLLLEPTYRPATFILDFIPDNAVVGILIGDGGSYEGVPDGEYSLTIGDNGPGSGAAGTAWIVGGEVVWVGLTAYGSGYVDPFAEVQG